MTRTWGKWGIAVLGAVTLCFALNGHAFAQESTEVLEQNVSLNTMWLLLAAFLVFFMQAGFALLEAGSTRSKNTVNILMKNLMDFSMAAIAFWAIGWGFAYGASAGGFIGISDFFLGFDPNEINEAGGSTLLANWLFQVVFAGTAATIVSGAMAERTKFASYLIFSFLITLFIYPIVVHWIWSGSGWLNSENGWGFTDFAGSTVVHSVGGWAALMGAIILGPRLGRFAADGTSQPIPGHNMALSALGVFILWLGWYGFNPGSQLAFSSQADANAISLVAVNTTLAAAAGALGAMYTTWFKNGKPDAVMTFNGVIGGLVAITAPCAYVTPLAAVIIGLVAGPLLVFSASWLESLKIDDPVGAIPAHLVNGVWGTLAVGLFASLEGNTGTVGLFSGGGFTLMISQIVGIVAVAIWTVVTTGVVFYALKMTIGLRVSAAEEEAGLDFDEHGSVAYPDILPTPGVPVRPAATGGVSSAPAK